MVTQATGTGRRDPDQESLETHFSMTRTQCTNRIWPKGYCPTQVLRGAKSMPLVWVMCHWHCSNPLCQIIFP